MLQVFNAGPPQAVVQRGSADRLSPKDLKQHRAAADAASLEELNAWQKHKAFARTKRLKGMNVMTGQYVVKWKVKSLPDGRS